MGLVFLSALWLLIGEFNPFILKVLDWPKRFFSLKDGTSSTHLSLTWLETILLDFIGTAVISACIFKKLSKLLNFCVAILILTMKENMQYFHHIMICYFKKGRNATKTHKKHFTVYGEDAVTSRTCQKWFAKFHAGDFFLDDAHWLGRTVAVDSDQIETLIENNQHIPCGR